MAAMPLLDPLVHALRTSIHARVVAALRPRQELLAGLPRPAELRAQQQALSPLLRELRARIEAAEDLQREDGPGFHARMTIERVLRRHPGAGAVLASVHLPACGGCAVRFDERLEEAAHAYGLDLPRLLAELNNLLSGPTPSSR